MDHDEAECYQCAQIEIHLPRCPYRLRSGVLTVDKRDTRAPQSPIALCGECGNFNIHRRDCTLRNPKHMRVEVHSGVLSVRGVIDDPNIGTRMAPGVLL